MIFDRIQEYIKEHTGPNILFVIKGYDFTGFEDCAISLEKTLQDKGARFMEIYQQSIKVISYEEFICLREIILSMFSKIYIFENKDYINLFPVHICIRPDIISALCTHYDEESQEEVFPESLGDYIDIYSNFLKIRDRYACRYNLDESYLLNEKIERLFISDDNPCDLVECTVDDATIFSICEESDYFSLVYSLEESDAIFAVSLDNAAIGKTVLQDKLRGLCGKYFGRLFSYSPPINKQIRKCPKEIYEALEQYWGYSSFRSIKMYDLAAVENHQKKVVAISQEDIICDLIEQAENCVTGKTYRDVFVTAPTGSGKSLMFQLPAIYLAEKYDLLTLVITPLIGLMKDQVQNLEERGYCGARTINSDIPPIVRDEILDSVASGKCDILYLSPESLLSRSDVEQLIGKRKIGMLVVDESHIVTTWGKQFRPDYWYLGDHIRKLRKRQSESEHDPAPFIIATFTATAIYGGNEDMYHETLNSLHMVNPITHLGHIRRSNISIEVSQAEKKTRNEYESDKFDFLISEIHKALIRGQKVLIYFPTVVLINSFKSYCYAKGLGKHLAIYHGQLGADEKDSNLNEFRDGSRLVMAATKAFGMGIDIPDISIVMHFAPTGNVCDYMQEVGRAARKAEIDGHAIYQHMSDDFKHINRLHGLSTIKNYQLIEVIKKILEIYTTTRYSGKSKSFTKKRNEMLVDAESFAYIFGATSSDDSDLIAKVKTAMLLIQKDYERRGFAPFYMRPIPVFAHGYFAISNVQQAKLNRKYRDVAQLVFREKNIFKVDLNWIWDRDYSKEMSFPKFKYLLYTQSPELSFNQQFSLVPAMSIDITFSENSELVFDTVINALHRIFQESISSGNYVKESIISEQLAYICGSFGINRYKAQNIINVFFAAASTYTSEYSKRINGRPFLIRVTNAGDTSYSIKSSIQDFFNWIKRCYREILRESVPSDSEDQRKLYIINDSHHTQYKEYITCLGILEAMGVLRFKSLGGSNSQLYIYVNSVKDMTIVRDRPSGYRNRLLELVNKRHKDSVNMLTFLFQNNFTSEEIWDHLENYFLGIMPDLLDQETVGDISIDYDDRTVILQIGDDFKEDYTSWSEAEILFDNFRTEQLELTGIPLADYYGAKLYAGIQFVDVLLAWQNQKIALVDCSVSDELHKIFRDNGWLVCHCETLDLQELKQRFEEE